MLKRNKYLSENLVILTSKKTIPVQNYLLIYTFNLESSWLWGVLRLWFLQLRKSRKEVLNQNGMIRERERERERTQHKISKHIEKWKVHMSPKFPCDFISLHLYSPFWPQLLWVLTSPQKNFLFWLFFKNPFFFFFVFGKSYYLKRMTSAPQS